MLSVPAHLPDGAGLLARNLASRAALRALPRVEHGQFAAHPAPGNRNSVPDTDRF